MQVPAAPLPPPLLLLLLLLLLPAAARGAAATDWSPLRLSLAEVAAQPRKATAPETLAVTREIVRPLAEHSAHHRDLDLDLDLDLDDDGDSFYNASTGDKSSCGRQVGKRIAILGGGPVGLVTAARAALEGGHDVDVWEKRAAYTREVWFDVYSAPWSQVVDWLERVGFFQVAREGSDYEKHARLDDWRVDVYTICCKSLEAFVLLLAAGAGVNVHLGSTLSYEDAAARSEFDLYVDASGSAAVWARGAQIPRQDPEVVRWHGKAYQPKEASQIHQWSWLAMVPSCENLTDLGKGDPFYLSSQGGVDEVVAVFSRAFAETCEVQVLFRSHARDRSKIIDEVILPRLQGQKPRTARMLRLSVHHLGRAAIEAKIGNQPLIVLGDASVPAYYRMGVGLTAGFSQIQAFMTDVSGAARLKVWQLQVDHAQRQAAVMAIETRCPQAFVGFDLGAPSMAQAPILYKYMDNDFIPVPISKCLLREKEDNEECLEKS